MEPRILGLLGHLMARTSFSTVTEPDFGVSLRWQPAETYKLTGSLKRNLGETTQYGSSGYLYTRLNLQLDKRMFTDYVGYISYGYGVVDYQDVTREDTLNSLGVGLNYYMSKHIFLSGSYSYINNDSNDYFYDYSRNLFLVSFKAKLAP